MRYIKFIILSVIGAIVLFGCTGKTEQAKAKYVFYFIGDGMGVNQVIGTEMYLAELEGRIGTKSLSFTSFPVRNYLTTYSATNAVTCSAAAGTALAAGTKTQNGRIGMKQDSSVLYSIACKAKQAGKAVGVTTSVAINHATPAVFYAHQPDRQMYYEIGTDAVKAEFDFYGGAGWKQVISPHDSSAIDLYSLLRDSGYMIIDHQQDFQALVCRGRESRLRATAGLCQSVEFARGNRPEGGRSDSCEYYRKSNSILVHTQRGRLLSDGGRWRCRLALSCE